MSRGYKQYISACELQFLSFCGMLTSVHASCATDAPSKTSSDSAGVSAEGVPQQEISGMASKEIVATLIPALMPRCKKLTAPCECLILNSLLHGLSNMEVVKAPLSRFDLQNLSNVSCCAYEKDSGIKKPYCREHSELSKQICLEATRVLSAMLGGDAEGLVCQDMLEAAPLLIAHLSGGMGTATAEQSAWILGKPSTDGIGISSTLVCSAWIFCRASISVQTMHTKPEASTQSVVKPFF